RSFHRCRRRTGVGWRTGDVEHHRRARGSGEAVLRRRMGRSLLSLTKSGFWVLGSRFWVREEFMTQRRQAAVFAAALALTVVAAGTHERAAESDLPLAKAESVGMSTQRLERIHTYIQGYIDRNE